MTLWAQQPPSAPARAKSPGWPTPDEAAGRAIRLAEAGDCERALAGLKTWAKITDKSLRLRAGTAVVRCAMKLEELDAAADTLLRLNREFPKDPDVLYLSVHAYSDLSARYSLLLATSSPTSYQARELHGEALEAQERWDEAAGEYRAILQQNPKQRGMHFRLGRILLSKPNPPPAAAEEAKKEFQQELEIDPSNAAAEYVLGELARQAQHWDDAIAHFTRATKLDAEFGDAFVGLGSSLVGAGRLADAIAPLETAVKMQPQNPIAHFNLATAYNRSGRKEDAQREFAIHRQMTQKQ